MTGAERNVLYRLGVAVDPSAKQGFESLARMADEMLQKWRKFENESAGATEESARKKRGSSKSYFDYMKAEEERAARNAQKLRDQEIANERRAHDEKRRMYERLFADQEAAEKKAADEARRRRDAELRDYARMQSQIKAGNAQVRQSAFEAAEGISRAVRGISLMGFVSDENLQKLLKTLAVVQGTSDIVLGSAKAYTALQGGIEGYTRAASAGSSVAGVGGAVAGGAGIATAGGAGAAGLGALAAGTAAATAAIVSWAGALSMAAEFIMPGSTGKGSIRGGEPGSLVAMVGYGQERIRSYLPGAAGRKFLYGEDADSVYTSAYESQEKTARLQKQLDAQRARSGGLEIDARIDRELEAARELNRQGGIDFSRSQFGDEGAFFGRFGSGSSPYQSEIDRSRQRATQFATTARGFDKWDDSAETQQKRSDAYEQAIAAERRLLGLVQERHDKEVAIGQQSIAYHDAAIQSVQQELALQERIRSGATERLESGRERFGAMAPSEQARVLNLSKMAAEANRLREAGRGMEADRITNRMTLQDLSALGSLPLEANQSIREYEYGRRAQIAGYDELGAEEKRAASEATKRIESLVAETTLNVEAKYVVEVDIESHRREIEKAREEIIKRLSPLVDELGQVKAEVRRITEKGNLQAGRDNRRGAGG